MLKPRYQKGDSLKCLDGDDVYSARCVKIEHDGNQYSYLVRILRYFGVIKNNNTHLNNFGIFDFNIFDLNIFDFNIFFQKLVCILFFYAPLISTFAHVNG